MRSEILLIHKSTNWSEWCAMEKGAICLMDAFSCCDYMCDGMDMQLVFQIHESPIVFFFCSLLTVYKLNIFSNFIRVLD